jgi:hypothetical protein
MNFVRAAAFTLRSLGRENAEKAFRLAFPMLASSTSTSTSTKQ